MNRTKFYAIYAVISFYRDGYRVVRTLPTFYLNAAVQGITDYLHAEREAEKFIRECNPDVDTLDQVAVTTTVIYFD